MVENNPTHSYMIKGRRVYQQYGKVTILYWGTFDIPFKQLTQQSIPKFYFGRKTHVFTFALGIVVFQAQSNHNIYIFFSPLVLGNIKVLKKRLPFIMITLFLSSSSLGLLTDKNTKNNSKGDLRKGSRKNLMFFWNLSILGAFWHLFISAFLVNKRSLFPPKF